jgi:hypothetical protein
MHTVHGLRKTCVKGLEIIAEGYDEGALPSLMTRLSALYKIFNLSWSEKLFFYFGCCI